MLLNPFSFNSASVTASTSIELESEKIDWDGGVSKSCGVEDNIPLAPVPLLEIRTCGDVLELGSDDVEALTKMSFGEMLVTGNRRLFEGLGKVRLEGAKMCNE